MREGAGDLHASPVKDKRARILQTLLADLQGNTHQVFQAGRGSVAGNGVCS